MWFQYWQQRRPIRHTITSYGYKAQEASFSFMAIGFCIKKMIEKMGVLLFALIKHPECASLETFNTETSCDTTNVNPVFLPQWNLLIWNKKTRITCISQQLRKTPFAKSAYDLIAALPCLKIWKMGCFEKTPYQNNPNNAIEDLMDCKF